MLHDNIRMHGAKKKKLVAQCFYFLIIALTCFGLSSWPSSGSSQIFLYV